MGLLNTVKFIIEHPFNRQRKMQALKRFLAWQIGSRLVPGPVVVPFVNNAVLAISPGMTGATGNIYTGLHEFEDMAFVLHLLRPDDLFVDVGANIGSYTILASAGVGAQSIAIEPLPDTFRHLVRNILLNDVKGRVSSHNIGIGREVGVLRFTSGLDTINHVANSNEIDFGGTVEVEVTKLDAILGSQQPSLIKIDVEGFETNVMLGAETTLSQQTLCAVIMELNGSGNRYGFDEGNIDKKMHEYGFRPFTYNPFNRKLMSLGGRNRAGNTLYIRNADFVQSRLFSAPKFSVLGRNI